MSITTNSIRLIGAIMVMPLLVPICVFIASLFFMYAVFIFILDGMTHDTHELFCYSWLALAMPIRNIINIARLISA